MSSAAQLLRELRKEEQRLEVVLARVRFAIRTVHARDTQLNALTAKERADYAKVDDRLSKQFPGVWIGGSEGGRKRSVSEASPTDGKAEING